MLLLTGLDLDITLVVRGRDIFDALQQLRLKLEPIAWYPLCNGPRVDCYPSDMARDMGGAQAVYVLTIGKNGKPPLMGTLDPAARDNVGTVAEQDAYSASGSTPGEMTAVLPGERGAHNAVPQAHTAS